MDISEVIQKSEALNVSSQDRQIISELIDLKTNENMKEVLSAINSLRSDIDTKFDSVEMRIKTLYWILGVCVVPVLVYVFKSFF